MAAIERDTGRHAEHLVLESESARMIVLKFGGTSVANAQRIRDAARIALDQPAPRVVVVSAAAGVTNALLEAARAAAKGDPERRAAAVARIHDIHHQILDGITASAARDDVQAALLDRHAGLDRDLDDIAAAGELSDRLSDRIVATGEKCLAILMAATLRDLGADARSVFTETVIATDNRHGAARPDRARTRENATRVIHPLLEDGATVVATGFIGASLAGETTTLGRGGSDYSATLLGAALDAVEVQIWTDVPGVLSADPRTVPHALVVPEISYDEAQELAHFGAKVLHPRTIRPAVARDIPVRILSTFAPDEPGTVVTRETSSDRIKAVTALSGLILLTLDVAELEDLAPAASAAFRVMHERGIEILTVSQSSSRRRMTYLIDAVGGGCPKLREHLGDAMRDSEAVVTCQEHVAVLAAVGNGAASTAAVLSRMMAVLHRAGVTVLATHQQTSNVAMLAVVADDDAARAVSAVHDAFIRPVAERRARRQRRSDLMAEAVRVG
ncbi:MAG: aspartate kinase [Chloroflexia bacterium]|nr:aspartate kinase [Chloroflexia bacterium]